MQQDTEEVVEEAQQSSSLDNLIKQCEQDVDDIDSFLENLKNVRGELIRYSQKKFISNPDIQTVATGSRPPYDWRATVTFEVVETGQVITKSVTQKKKKTAKSSAVREALRDLMRIIPRAKLTEPKPKAPRTKGLDGSGEKAPKGERKPKSGAKEIPSGGEALKAYVDELLSSNGNVRGLLQRYVQKRIITTPEFKTRQAAPPPGTRWMVECEVVYEGKPLVGSGLAPKKSRASAQACGQVVKLLADVVPEEALQAATTKEKKGGKKRKRKEAEEAEEPAGGGGDGSQAGEPAKPTPEATAKPPSPDEAFINDVVANRPGGDCYEQVVKFVDEAESLTTYSRLFGYLMSKKFLDTMNDFSVGQWLLCLSRNRTKFSVGQQRAYVDTLGRVGLKTRFEETLRMDDSTKQTEMQAQYQAATVQAAMGEPPTKKLKTEEEG